MNIISKENLKSNSHILLRSLIQSSSEMNGCPITNILSKEIKSIWLSAESLPQEIIINLSKNYLIKYPTKLCAIGIYCWHAYSTNPKLIEVLISNKNNSNFLSLGDFDLELKPGLQLLHLDEDLLLNKDNKLNEELRIKLIIKETYGEKRTYINNLSLYENIDNVNSLNITKDNEEENNSVVYIKESRIKNNYAKFGKKNNVFNNSGNIILTSEMLISDSELSEKKQFGDKVDKFFGINSKLKIPEISETKENNSSLNYNDSIKLNNKRSKNKNLNKSPVKSTRYENAKNNMSSGKKSILNSNINIDINTQNSNNNMNKELLTTELMKSQIDYQNDFFTPEKQNKFFGSKGEISNIDYVGDNLPLINEFKSYQKLQDEKMKKFDERLKKVENKMEQIDQKLETISNNLNELTDIVNMERNKTKKKEKKTEIDTEKILQECENMIKMTLLEILDKKISPDIVNRNYSNNEEMKVNSYYKLPEGKNNKSHRKFYITNSNKNAKSTIDYSSKKNITIEPETYLTHKIPFYPNEKNEKTNTINNNNHISYHHKRKSTYSQNYANLNKNIIDNSNQNFTNSQNVKYTPSTYHNNYSEFSESNMNNKFNSIRVPYYDVNQDVNSNSVQGYNSHTPMGCFPNVNNIPKKSKQSINSMKGLMLKNNNNTINANKQHSIKLKKTKSNLSCLTYKNNNTISNSNSYSNMKPKISNSKRQYSHKNLNNKDEITEKINNHLEEKFADFSDKLEKNINDCLLKPSIAKLKKIVKKNFKQVKHSLKKAEISQRLKNSESNF